MSDKYNYRSVLCQDDFETIVLSLQREESAIVDLLNSGRILKEDQDKAFRNRCYTVQELLARLTGNQEAR
jgi:hypothetical protein